MADTKILTRTSKFVFRLPCWVFENHVAVLLEPSDLYGLLALAGLTSLCVAIDAHKLVRYKDLLEVISSRIDYYQRLVEIEGVTVAGTIKGTNWGFLSKFVMAASDLDNRLARIDMRNPRVKSLIRASVPIQAYLGRTTSFGKDNARELEVFEKALDLHAYFHGLLWGLTTIRQGEAKSGLKYLKRAAKKDYDRGMESRMPKPGEMGLHVAMIRAPVLLGRYEAFCVHPLTRHIEV